MTLALVATLGTRALADTDVIGDGGMPPASGSVGAEGWQAEGWQAEGSADPSEDQPPAAAQDPTGPGDPGTARAADGEGTGTVNLPTGGKGPQDPASLAVAGHRQEVQPPADRSPEVDPDGTLGEAEQLAQRLDASQGCSAEGGCGEGPGIPGVPTMAATPGGGRSTPPGDDRPRDSSADSSPEGRAVRERIFNQQAELDNLRYEMALVRAYLRNVRNPQTLAERKLDLQEEVGHPIEDRHFQARIDSVRRSLEQLRAAVQPGTAASDELNVALQHLDELSGQAARGVVPRRRGESSPPGGGSAMSIVDPEAAGLWQAPSEGDRPVIPHLAGYGSGTPVIPGPTGYAGDRPEIPDLTGFGTPVIPTNLPGYRPEPVDTRPLTRNQEASRGRSDTAERLQHASQTTAKVGLAATAGGLALTGLYYTWLALQAAYGGLAGLMPAEVLETMPGVAPRPTQG